MDENILKLKELFKSNSKYRFKSIKKKINCDTKTLLDYLNILQKEGYIIYLKSRYQLMPNNFKVVNVKLSKEGYGYFEYNRKKYKINGSNLNHCLNNDKCIVCIENNKAKVVKILERKTNLISCKMKDGNLIAYSQPFEIKIIANTKGIYENDIAIVRIDDDLNGKVVEILGNKNDPNTDLKLIAIANNFNVDFNSDVLKQLNNIKDCVTEEDLKGRIDLRNKLIYTIDCDDTKDMDDAINIEINEHGNYLVGVHIADVSNYVKLDSPIFNEALKRGTSVYMLDTVIPMIPKELSNGICSLNPNVDRLTITCLMEINKDGDVVDNKIFKSVINSRKKMNYSSVNKILNDNESVEGYEEYVDNLKIFEKLNTILSKNFNERGFLTFGNTEIKVVMDELGKPIDFVSRNINTAEKIIENLMILTNETITENYGYLMPSFIFRVHDTPERYDIIEAVRTLRSLGYKMPLPKNLNNPVSVQNLLNNLKTYENFDLTSSIILKSMKKAYYSTDNIGHFGLATYNYTHFTSPIRRLPDLLIQYIIDENINFPYEKLDEYCRIASTQERNADEAEMEAERMKMAEYMESHIGEYFNGQIINITKQYILIKTIDNIIGFVYVDGNYMYENNTIMDRKTKYVYKIGDYIRVKVTEANKELRSVKFKIVDNLNKTLKKEYKN